MVSVCGCLILILKLLAYIYSVLTLGKIGRRIDKNMALSMSALLQDEPYWQDALLGHPMMVMLSYTRRNCFLYIL